MPATPRISNAEWRVMEVLWARSPASALEVADSLAPETHWKPKTVMTLLKRLVHKGALDFNVEGRAYHYYPLVERSACVRTESRSFLRRVSGGSLKPMLASFLEEADLSAGDIEELRAILDAKEKDL